MEKHIEHYLDQNPLREFADVVVNLLTKEQLKILKSRLMFDPRKLPLKSPDLAQSLHQADDNFIAYQKEKFIRLSEEFERLVLPEQLESLQTFATHIAQQIEECENDARLNMLESLLGHLLTFLESERTP